MTGELSFDDALRLHQKGRFVEAEQVYRGILASEPSHTGALHLLGVIRQQQGRHEEALELVGRAIALNPTKAVYHNNYGAALQSLGRHVEALASFQRALEIRPQYADALANRGMAQVSLGQDDAALASFQTALELHPGHPDAMSRLAALLQKVGRGKEAIPLYEKALIQCPSAELKTQFSKLTVLTRAAEGRARTTPYDRLLFDGRHYYTYDEDGNRMARYQVNAHGDRFNFTTYDWDDRKRLTAVGCWDVSGHCTTKVDYARGISNLPAESSLAAAGTKEEYHYDGRHPFLSERNNPSVVRKVAFVSPHCVLDFTNGAATATLDGLQLFQQLGFESQAFCSSRLDAQEEVLLEEILAQRKVRYEVRNARLGHNTGRIIFTWHGSVPITLLNTASTRGGSVGEEETAVLLNACEVFLTRNRPDAVWTYGGDPVSLMMQRVAKRLGIPIVFSLHNFGYRDREVFRAVDYVVVPSDHLPQMRIDLRSISTLTIMPNTPDARDFLAITKALVMPSLMENVGLVAMEAMLNGVPVLGSNRGALSETIGADGLLFEIPVRYTQQSPEIPTAEEVAPWVETIIRLWDDHAYYERRSRAARERSRLWHPDYLASTYRDFFGNLCLQPGPPLVPKVDA